MYTYFQQTAAKQGHQQVALVWAIFPAFTNHCSFAAMLDDHKSRLVAQYPADVIHERAVVADGITY